MGQGSGQPQRNTAAEWLGQWLQDQAAQLDSNVLIMGDWNETPSADTWASLHQLEHQGEVEFKSLNSESNYSHLYYKSKK